MPKASKRAPSAQCTIEQVLPEESDQEETSSDEEVFLRFLKWRLKCENILECELAMLSETRKCKKIVAWSGDFGLDQYISWNLSSKDLTLEVIWKTFEEFCKLQANELRARFDY